MNKKCIFKVLITFTLLAMLISPVINVGAKSLHQDGIEFEIIAEPTLETNEGTLDEMDDFPLIEEVNEYLKIKHSTLEDGTGLSAYIINGPPKPPPGYEGEHEASIMPLPTRGVITDFPSFDWVFGCSAVSGAMIAAYYDRGAFPNMYLGPTNGGVMPNTDTSWPDWSDGYDTYPNNPLIASHNGVDGRTTRGSIDNYWVKYGSTANDPYITNGWSQHTWGTAIGDFMKTSQSAYGNTDGATTFYNYTTSGDKLTCADMVNHDIADEDGTYGRKLFYEARGYTVTDCYSQRTDVTGGFSLTDFQAEIDAGHPVLINVEGHSMVGYGYSGSTIYIRDTWDSNPSNTYTMPWGGSYYGMVMYAVSVVKLNQAPTNITLSKTSVPEDKPINTVVGTFSTTDPNPGDTHTYALVSGTGSADNASFNVLGNQLRTSQVFDKDVKDTYTIRVRSTDQGDLYFEKQFTITVTDTSTGGNIYLPLIISGGGSTSSGIVNGGFEQGSVGWTEYSYQGWDLILNEGFTPVSAHGGDYLAWLGGDYNETSRVSQSVPISASQPYLHFWY